MLIISNSAPPPSCSSDNEPHLPCLRTIRQPETNYASIKIITRPFFSGPHPHISVDVTEIEYRCAVLLGCVKRARRKRYLISRRKFATRANVFFFERKKIVPLVTIWKKVPICRTYGFAIYEFRFAARENAELKMPDLENNFARGER